MPKSSDVVPGTDINASDQNKLREDLFTGKRINEDVTAAETVTLDLSDVANGNFKTIDLDQSITLRFSGITDYPTAFFVRFIQDATGGWTLTIDQTGMKYPAKTAPVISAGANETTALMFVCWAVNEWECYFAGFDVGEPA